MVYQRIVLLVLSSLLFAVQPVMANQTIDLKLLQDIPNVTLLQEDVIGGGTLSKKALEELKRQKFKSVIDLRTMIEGTAAEQVAVKKLGIKYFNIPIHGSDVSEAQVKRLEEILSNPDNRPALLHCAVGGRVHALWKQYKGKGSGAVMIHCLHKALLLFHLLSKAYN